MCSCREETEDENKKAKHAYFSEKIQLQQKLPNYELESALKTTEN